MSKPLSDGEYYERDGINKEFVANIRAAIVADGGLPGFVQPGQAESVQEELRKQAAFCYDSTIPEKTIVDTVFDLMYCFPLEQSPTLAGLFSGALLLEYSEWKKQVRLDKFQLPKYSTN